MVVLAIADDESLLIQGGTSNVSQYKKKDDGTYICHLGLLNWLIGLVRCKTTGQSHHYLRIFMQNLPKSLRWLPLKTFIITAVIMTLYEFIKEVVSQGRLSPWESHIITILVSATIATTTSVMILARLRAAQIKEQKLAVEESALESQRLLLSASNHIVNNAFNYIQLVNAEVDEHGRVSSDTLALVETSIDEATRQMIILNSVVEPRDPKSYAGIFPQ
jgi:hypothetical protein